MNYRNMYFPKKYAHGHMKLKPRKTGFIFPAKHTAALDLAKQTVKLQHFGWYCVDKCTKH